MKTLKSTLVLMLLLTGSTTFSQVGKSYKAQNITATGHILNQKGDTLGIVHPDGMVNTMKGKKIGFIAPDGTVTDKDGKRLGKAEKNGNYYDANGTLMLTVKDQGKECEILDPKGHKIGTVHENYKMHACAIHCFNFEEGHK